MQHLDRLRVWLARRILPRGWWIVEPPVERPIGRLVSAHEDGTMDVELFGASPAAITPGPWKWSERYINHQFTPFSLPKDPNPVDVGKIRKASRAGQEAHDRAVLDLFKEPPDADA